MVSLFDFELQNSRVWLWLMIKISILLNINA